MLSIATNVSENDDARIRTTVPHWFRTFGELVSEVFIVVDMQARTGRMADSEHAVRSNVQSALTVVKELAASDSRVKFVTIDGSTDRERVSRAWFKWGSPWRCQGGSPLFGYVLAIEEAANDTVLKVDCDMLFCDRGWLRSARDVLSSDAADVVEPARSLAARSDRSEVSTRVFAINKKRFRNRVLPMEPHQLGIFRRVHRRLHGRPTWLALERMLQAEIDASRLRYRMLPATLGFSLHVPKREEFLLPGFANVVARVEMGDLPGEQQHAWDFAIDLWPSSTWS